MIRPVSSVSFGKRLPLGYCEIKDKEKGKNVSATFFEYTCENKKDIEDFAEKGKNLPSFQESTIRGMDKKIHNYPGTYQDRYYGIYTGGEVVGMAKVKKDYRHSEIQTLVTDHDRYSYAGQSLLALIGKETVKNASGPALITIEVPLPAANDFYTKGCGFYTDRFYPLVLRDEDLSEFIEKMEEKTKVKLYEDV